jgi:hypothetical protein
LSNGKNLPPFINFKTSVSKFYIQTNDETTAGTYNILVTAIVINDDETMLTNKALSWTLVVLKPDDPIITSPNVTVVVGNKTIVIKQNPVSKTLNATINKITASGVMFVNFN